VITIEDEQIKNHNDRVVRGSVEETLNALLDAEADRLCNAQRYERNQARRDTRAGHYERKLQTGEVRLKIPKLPAVALAWGIRLPEQALDLSDVVRQRCKFGSC
jgi:transposase-like protein